MIPDLLAFKLSELDISNITAVVLVVVALVFVGSFEVVPLKTANVSTLPRRIEGFVLTASRTYQ